MTAHRHAQNCYILYILDAIAVVIPKIEKRLRLCFVGGSALHITALLDHSGRLPFSSMMDAKTICLEKNEYI